MIPANFTAQLHCQYGRIGVAHTQLQDHFVTSSDIDGWLCTQENKHFKPGNGDPKNAAHKDFYLRNSNGFRVARSTLKPQREVVLNGGSFLNASSREGDVLVCRLSNIELLDV